MVPRPVALTGGTALEASQDAAAPSSLSNLPGDVLAQIYLQLRQNSDRCSFYHSCKAVHESEAIGFLITGLRIVFPGGDGLQQLLQFPRHGRLQRLTLDGSLAGSLSLKAPYQLADFLHAASISACQRAQVLLQEVRRVELLVNVLASMVPPMPRRLACCA
jgi:hypothetical protein